MMERGQLRNIIGEKLQELKEALMQAGKDHALDAAQHCLDEAQEWLNQYFQEQESQNKDELEP